MVSRHHVFNVFGELLIEVCFPSEPLSHNAELEVHCQGLTDQDAMQSQRYGKNAENMQNGFTATDLLSLLSLDHLKQQKLS